MAILTAHRKEFRNALVLCLALAIPACSDSPQSAEHVSSVSGTVVYEQSGSPASDVEVVLEQCRTGTMMMGDRWDQTQHMTTDAHGGFHFQYTHESMHRYRVSVHGMADPHACYGGDEDGVVLRVPMQSP